MILKNKLRSSIAKKFVFYILIFSSFTALISTSIQLFFEYKRDIAALEKTAEQIENSHKSTIAQALWAYDVVIMETQLKGIKNLPGVLYACIKKNNIILIEIGAKDQPLKMQSYQYLLSHTVKNKQVQLGALEVEINLSDVYNRLLNRITVIFITQISKTFFVSLFIFFLFYLLVGRHLKSIAHFADTMDFNNIEEKLVLNRKTKENKSLDELSLVETAFNKMKRKLTNQVEELRVSQKTLAESEERFQLAMQFANDGLFDWWLETNEIYYSPGWKRMLGYEDDELPNDFSAWETLTESDDIKKFWTMQQELISKNRDRFKIEFRMKHKQGHWVYILSRAKAIFDDNGKAIRIIGTHVDITDRKKAENDLLKQKQFLQKAQEIGKIGTWELDIKKNELLWTEENYKIFGIPIGTKLTYEIFLECVHPEDRNYVDTEWKAAFKGKTYDISHRLIVNNKTKWVREKAELIFNENGECIKGTGFTQDFTEKRQLQVKLQQAQKMESIGTLASGIAHDFNNLLFPIIGMSELLLEDLPKDSLEYENATEIYHAGRRAGDLVKQILAFSRQSEHKMAPVRVQKVLKEVLRLGRSTIPSNVEIHQDIQQNCGLVLADSIQIHQVAMNLITNAVHAVEEKNGAIDIKLKEVTLKDNELPDGMLQSGKYIRLSISDNGIGMSQTIINKIFEPYFTTKAQGKGTGLGLSVVYGIVKKHGGDIKVYSEFGKGTTFNMYLPLMKKSTETAAVKKQSSIATGTENILLVDDEASIAKLEGQMLSRFGYQVTIKTNSIEALKIFKQNPESFDLVISDMTMPNMTGDKLAIEILSIKPNLPIIICTGFSERINNEQAEFIGVKGFLMKPVTISDLTQMVRKVLDETKTS